MIKFIRIFWGDVNRYKHQIDKCSRVDEVVFVYGKDNEEYFRSKGFETFLMKDTPYDYSIASAHTMYDHKSLIHKLVAFDKAVKMFGEVVFVDWDCYKIKDVDDNFFSLLKQGNELQVPLYIYPTKVLQELCDSKMNVQYNDFFNKLKNYLVTSGYDFNGDYVIPNTGFMYCRDAAVSSKLVDLAYKENLETVPDELAVLKYFESLSLEQYIEKVEPNVIFGKHHSDNSEWNTSQLNLNSFISDRVDKTIYFHHV